MKRLIFFVLTLLLVQNRSFAQDFDEYLYPDGTIIKVKVVSDDPDEQLKSNMYIGAFGFSGQVPMIGYSHYVPQKFYLNGMLGITGGMIDATFIFKNSFKAKTLKQSVDVKYTKHPDFTEVTKYVVQIPSRKRKSLGVHTGLEVFRSDIHLQSNSEDYRRQAIGIMGGLSLIRARSAHLEIKSEYGARRGSLVSRLNLDVIVYPVRSVERELLADEKIGDLLRPVGARLYYDGRTSTWSKKGRLSFNYMFGVNIPMLTDASFVIGGLAIGYSFN